MPWDYCAGRDLLWPRSYVFWLGRPTANSNGDRVDPYAKYVTLGNVQVSQASNFAGDQLTYVDGTIQQSRQSRHRLDDDPGGIPQCHRRRPLKVLQAPLSLRPLPATPYVDTQPVSAVPFVAGKTQDFRLVFDNVSPYVESATSLLRIVDVGNPPLTPRPSCTGN